MLVRDGQKVWPEDERVWQTGEVGGASQGILRSRLGWRLEHRDPAMGEVSWCYCQIPVLGSLLGLVGHGELLNPVDQGRILIGVPSHGSRERVIGKEPTEGVRSI